MKSWTEMEKEGWKVGPTLFTECMEMAEQLHPNQMLPDFLVEIRAHLNGSADPINPQTIGEVLGYLKMRQRLFKQNHAKDTFDICVNGMLNVVVDMLEEALGD